MLTTQGAKNPLPSDDSVAMSQACVEEDRRTSERVALRVSLKLLGLGSTNALPCTVSNVSAGGLFVHVPMGSGLEVGQRYEVKVPAPRPPAQLAGIAGEGAYATVVRTKQLAQEPAPLIGAAMRFDQPLVL